MAKKGMSKKPAQAPKVKVPVPGGKKPGAAGGKDFRGVKKGRKV